MDLIIKPTERCNYKCSFCSSSDIADGTKPSDDLDVDDVLRFLKRYPNTNTIIVNGGDPLMMHPRFYEVILDYIEENNLNTVVSFTTNLLDWDLHPKKWDKIFRHPNVGINTSFNYGNTRKITDIQVYTEELFLKTQEKFKATFGYYLDFIAVVTEENEDKAIDNVRLAKMLNVECKLNYAMASGMQSKPYPVGKMYKIYMEIYKEGLGPWEFSTRQMTGRLKDLNTTCPLNRKCDEGIRSLQPWKNGQNYYSCGAFGDDGEYPISFESEMSGGSSKPLQEAKELKYLKAECLTCPAFDICNGCYKTIRDLKRHDMVEESCAAMKSVIEDIKETKMIDQEESLRLRKFFMVGNE